MGGCWAGIGEIAVFFGVCIVVVGVACGFGAASAPAPMPSAVPLDAQGIVGRNEAAVVVVLGVKGADVPVQSSGCFVSASGLVLTTAHQVAGVTGLRARLHDGGEVGLSLVALDEAHELALLQADLAATPAVAATPAATAVQAVTIGDASLLSGGAALLSIAAPRNLAMSTVDGIVSNTERTYRGYRVIQTNLPAEPGSSGGPVFDSRGELVGVIVGRLQEQAWVTLINPINNAYGLLGAHGVSCPGRIGGAADLDGPEGEIVPAPGIGVVEREAIQAYNRGCQAALPAEKAGAYGAAATLLPQFYEAWFNLGCARMAAGEPGPALQAYERARQLRPEAPEPLRNGGRVLLSLGRLDEAAAWFEQGVLLGQEEPSFHNDLGETYRRMGKLDTAAAALLEALRLKPEFPAAVYNLALTLADGGRNAEAAQYLERYLVLAPDAPDVLQVKQWLARLRDDGAGER